jgi:hypothetical protein
VFFSIPLFCIPPFQTSPHQLQQIEPAIETLRKKLALRYYNHFLEESRAEQYFVNI